jgi:hypothetical protein
VVGKRKRSWKRILLWVIGILVVVFALMQAVPYGRSHTNPPAVNPFKWNDPQAEAIARVSCYDCHSNETKWWWATNVAPFSWLVQADVNGGRGRLNFSEYAGGPSLEEFQHAVEGGMPPFQYTIVHRSAKLSDAQKQTLIKGYAGGIAASGGSSSAPTTSADAAAVAVINQACASCHSANEALNFRAASAGEAQALIDNMIQRGAKLTAEQQQLLVRYYTR